MTAGGVRVDQRDGASVVALSGEVDATVAPGMAARLADVVQDASAVVLDLAAVEFFDSAGVRLVDRLARGCAAQGLPWRVVAPPASAARRVLELVGMVGPEVVDDLGAALRSVAPEA